MIFLLNMNLELENIGKKMFNSIPLRRSLIPKFIYIDTVVLIDLSDLKNKDNYNKNICKYQEFIWNKYFNFNPLHKHFIILFKESPAWRLILTFIHVKG
jgi:hypothetical protein